LLKLQVYMCTINCIMTIKFINLQHMATGNPCIAQLSP
jgi:hypothetical protein